MLPEIFTIDCPQTEITPRHLLRYARWGNPNAPAVVCVHGLTRNGRDFDVLAERLAEDYYVICPDMPGRGTSEWIAPASYHYGTYVSDMAHLLRSLELQQVRWVGTSMGGIIGMMLAASQPGLIQAMALNDVGTVVSAAGLKRIGQYAGINMAFDSTEAAELAMRANLSTFGITSEAHWRHLFTYGLRTADDGRVHFTYDPAIMQFFPKGDDVKDIELWGLWEALKALPLLLIRGASSDLLTRETASAMQAQHPRMTLLEIEDAGHAPSLMDDVSIATILQWIKTAT